MAGDWVKVELDIIWAQRDGADVDAHGRGKMRTAVRQGDVNYMGMYKEGFHECQRSPFTRANFDACATEDQGKVYNIGRKTEGLPAI